MRGVTLAMAAILAILCTGGAAQAEERYMTLWPNQRASHQAEIESDAEVYHARGQSYVDHLYDSGGESDITDPDNLHQMDLDLYPAALQPVDVDIDEVAGIVKASGQGEVIVNPDPVSKDKSAAKTEVKSEPKPESANQPKTELKAEPKVESSKVESGVEPKTEDKVDSKTDAKNESVSDLLPISPEAKTAPQNSVEGKPEPAVETKPEAKTEPRADFKPETMFESNSATQKQDLLSGSTDSEASKIPDTLNAAPMTQPSSSPVDSKSP